MTHLGTTDCETCDTSVHALQDSRVILHADTATMLFAAMRACATAATAMSHSTSTIFTSAHPGYPQPLRAVSPASTSEPIPVPFLDSPPQLPPDSSTSPDPKALPSHFLDAPVSLSPDSSTSPSLKSALLAAVPAAEVSLQRCVAIGHIGPRDVVSLSVDARLMASGGSGHITRLEAAMNGSPVFRVLDGEASVSRIASSSAAAERVRPQSMRAICDLCPVGIVHASTLPRPHRDVNRQRLLES